MTPPKKMSLQEFFSDESYGGSWADDEIDISSISVPIEKNRDCEYRGTSQYGFGGNRYGSSSNSGFGRASYLDNGPPYIMKLSNIPVTSNDAFIEDLFRSRFTPMVKFKILFDPFSQPLESGIIKKIAFVELPSFDSQNKVAKWHDVFYKGTRRVTIEVANFNDFQQSMRFNQENHEALLQTERTFFSSRPRSGHHEDVGSGRDRFGRGPAGMPLDNIPLPDTHHRFGPQLQKRTASNAEGQTALLNATATTTTNSNSTANSTAKAKAILENSDNTLTSNSEKKSILKPKPNPFGNAKPIDVLARQHEIEKNLIVSKHTIMRAPWAKEDAVQPVQTNQSSPNSVYAHAGVLVDSDRPIPVNSVQESGPKKSLADILSSSKARDQTKNSRASSANSTPKLVIRKPTVIMKKPKVSPPAPETLGTNQGDVKEIEKSTAELSISPNHSARVCTPTSMTQAVPDNQEVDIKSVSIDTDSAEGKSDTTQTKHPRTGSARRVSRDKEMSKHPIPRNSDQIKVAVSSHSAGSKEDDTELRVKNVPDTRPRRFSRKSRRSSATMDASIEPKNEVNNIHLGEKLNEDEMRNKRRDYQKNRPSRRRSTVEMTESSVRKVSVGSAEQSMRKGSVGSAEQSMRKGSVGSAEQSMRKGSVGSAEQSVRKAPVKQDEITGGSKLQRPSSRNNMPVANTNRSNNDTESKSFTSGGRGHGRERRRRMSLGRGGRGGRDRPGKFGREENSGNSPFEGRRKGPQSPSSGSGSKSNSGNNGPKGPKSPTKDGRTQD